MHRNCGRHRTLGSCCQESNAAPSRVAYHGLARGIVRVTAVVGSTTEQTALLAQLNPEAGAGPRSARVVVSDGGVAEPIVVQADVPGLPAATLSIPTSIDPLDSVFAVAARSVGVAYTGE